MTSGDAVQDIKDRLNIEDVVSEYVELKRSGRNYKGLSPFTNEKSASFMVSPEKQIWHDFSSGRGGDIFSFIQAVEGVDFKASLEMLARKAGVELADYRQNLSSQSRTNAKAKERLFQAVEDAATFYQKELLKNTPALKYLREKRGYEKQTILDFRFGYSPEKGDALTQYLLKKYDIGELRKAGLSGERNGRQYDMFRGRIMIPLKDSQGRPVGFTARLLKNDPDSPKYINTPATLLYDKGRQLYGFSQAKEAIRKRGFVVVVEGNLDVVASHQANVKNVVASAGTALTQYHLKDLQRFTGDIRVAFDEDNAGQAAVERTIPLAQELGLEMSVISVPSGKDPDELIKENPKSWQKVINQHVYMIDWLIERIASNLDMSSAQGKRQFTSRVFSVVRQLKDEVEREHYLKKTAERIGASYESVKAKLASEPAVKRRLRRVKVELSDTADKEQRVREQHLLAIALRRSDIAVQLQKLPLDVFSEDAQEAARQLQEHPGVTPEKSDYVTMLSLLFEEFYQSADTSELAYQANQLLSRLVKTYANNKKQSLIQDMESADENSQKTLLTAVKHLDDIAKQFAAH